MNFMLVFPAKIQIYFFYKMNMMKDKCDSNMLVSNSGGLSVGSLGAYVHWVNQMPMLTEDEEKNLANRFRKLNDLKAARQMVLSHLRFVVRVARGYAGYGLPEADLIQEGSIGLMKAVKRFDPKVGVRLVSFAVHWIRSEIHEYIIRNWRIVKIATTKAQRKLFFNLRKASKQRGWFSDDEINTVAEALKVSQKDVRQMEMRLNSYDQSLEHTSNEDENDDLDWQAPINYLEDNSANPESALESNNWENTQQQKLHLAIQSLDSRSQEIIQQRWLNDKKLTLLDLSKKFNVSIERIRQLEQIAIEKMRLVIASQ